MRKRILFVTHALESLYGAATSLRLLLENYSEVEADVLLPRSLRQPRDLSRTAALYGFRRAYELSLPVDLALVGVKREFQDMIHGALHWINWQRGDRRLYRELLQRNHYDVIHLNSTILHHLALPGFPFVSHIREIVTTPGSPAVARLQRGLGLIFIDEATQKPFVNGRNTPWTILNNPVDMSDIAAFEARLNNPRLRPDNAFFSIVGQIYEAKGVEFVIDAYRKGAAPNTLLIIAGDGPAAYVERCRQAAANDPRILFWGAEKEIKRIYAATDYVVRGETRHCVGRTVYEGLYAGCRVIMPGQGEQTFLFEADQFSSDILLYKARDTQSLAAAFAASSGRKVTNRAGRSNINAYVQAFDGFLDHCLAGKIATSPRLFPDGGSN